MNTTNENSITFNVRTSDIVGHINVTFRSNTGITQTIGLNTNGQGTVEMLGNNQFIGMLMSSTIFYHPVMVPFDGKIVIEDQNIDIRRTIFVDRSRFDAAWNYARSRVGSSVDYQLFTEACVDFATDIYNLAGGIGSVGNLFRDEEIGNLIGFRLRNQWQGKDISNSEIWNQEIYNNAVNLLGNSAILAHCFPVGTAIRLADGTEKTIEHIGGEDHVQSFDASGVFGRGGTVSKRVTRVFTNITDTWISLSNGLTVTPGHHFLDAFGSFRTIAEILATDAQIVLEDGSVAAVTGEYIHYSAATAGMFEQAEGYAFAAEGSAALAPLYKKGWKTYNFEVEDFHTYIAGGVRVHNQSVFTASGKDLTVGDYTGANGYSYHVNDDGSVTNLTTGHVAAGNGLFSLMKFGSAVEAEALLGRKISPTEQYDWANQGLFAKEQVNGSGPAVNLASGSVANAGTTFTLGNGYSYHVNSNGSVTNLDTGHTSGVGTRTYNADTNSWQTVQAPVGSSGSGNSGGSSGGGSNSSIVINGTLMPTIAMNGNPANTYGFTGGSLSSSSSSGPSVPKGSSSQAKPILIDLDGDGISLTQQSSSNMFYDMAGDGKQHRTAWAGAGDGVLVRDADNDGIIKARNEVDFTEWDTTAKSDLQALRNVFDTNHNNKLDAGDADWALFKVLVSNGDGTTTLKTLAELGITSIDLISNNQETSFADIVPCRRDDISALALHRLDRDIAPRSCRTTLARGLLRTYSGHAP